MHGLTLSIIVGCFVFTLAHDSILEEFTTERIRITRTNPNRQLKFTSEKKLSLKSLSATGNLGHGSGFRYANRHIMKSAKGVKRVRLIQTYAGYDVMGSAVAAEMDMNEDFTGQMYGQVVKNIYHDIPDAEACQLMVKHLHTKALQLEHIEQNTANVNMKDGRRLIFVGPESKKPKLAYKIEFFYRNASDVKYPVYFFDACNGEVLDSYDQLMTFHDRNTYSKGSLPLKSSTPQSPSDKMVPLKSLTPQSPSASSCDPSCIGEGGNEKSGKVTYNTPPLCLDVDKNLVTCTFDGEHAKLVDNKGSTGLDKTTAVNALCINGYKDPVNGAYGVGNDAFYHAYLFGEFFEEKYETDILDYKPRVVVHFDTELDNAYSDGTDTFYGDGASYFYPLVSLDIVAHELAHAVTDKNSRLVYRGMSGGINEAFSDITGATVVAWSQSGESDWKIGGTVIKEGDALRYMDDPTRDGRSIKTIFGYRFLMSVHSSSGIFNHAFYHMVETQEMSIYDAYKCFLDANLNLWGSTTNFFSAACNVMQAAYDNGFDHAKVRRAFWPTRIPLFFCRYSALSTTMYIGETREEILVRDGRSPIIKVELDTMQSNFTVKAIAKDNSPIELFIGIDNEVSQVIAKGHNIVKLSNAPSPLYVKLTSKALTDVPVKMTV